VSKLDAIQRLAGRTVAASSLGQVQAMTDEELAEALLTGRWTTLEVHEAGRRLRKRLAQPSAEDGGEPRRERG
jgi:hypothetical protein